MAADERWYFSKEDILNSPSRKCGIDGEKELSYRQQGAKLIQDMGQRLQVTQLVINTAIVYMHRFYMFHPFTKFHRNSIAPAALFLAAKVEEQPRKLEHVIKVGHYILCHHEHSNLDTQSEAYQEKAQELVMNENILLQTLGFDVAIDHPHTHVVKCFQMVRSKCSSTTELAQTSYFMATNSLHMTTMCLQYRPSIVACVCIYIVCKWSNYEIQRYTEGKDWFAHVDSTVTLEMLENLTTEFLAVLDKYPSRLKKLMNSGGPHAGPSNNFGEEKAIRHNNVPMNIRPQAPAGASATPKVHELGKPPGISKPITQPPVPQKTVLSHKEYSEKREKERRDRERAETREKLHASNLAPSGSHHLSSGHPMALHISSSSSHQRPQPSETLMRKPHAEGTRPSVPSTAARAGPAFKEPIPKRELIRSDEKEERTSVNSLIDSSAKFVTEKLKSSSDIRHSVDWNQSRQLEYINNNRKDIKLDTKSDFKPIIKDSKVINDNREHIKPDSYSKHYNNNNNSNKNVMKSETPPVTKVKAEKVELKDEPKVQGVKEVKHNNSFIFNNNDFSLRDFLNPSEIPPEDIFDTEVDSKPPLFNSADFLPGETTHHKLNSPPRHPVASNQNQSTSHTTTASNSTVVKASSASGSSTSNSKQPIVEAVHTENKPNSRHANPSTAPSNNAHTRGNHSSEKNNFGNGLPNVHNVMQSTLQTPPVRRKEKVLSPRSVVSQASTAKVKLQRLETTVLPPSIKFDDKRHLTTKDLQSPIKQNLLKDAVTTSHNVTVVITTTTTTPPGKPGTTTTQSQSYTPVKQIPDHLKADSLSIRLPRPESGDLVSAVSTNAPVTLSTNSSSTIVPSPLKAYKQEHRSHKNRKEKKKHKHKEKDKNKDKESKEHKKARKHKKKDKEKDKEREKEKDKDKKAEKQNQKDSSRPLKITIMRGKGVCTPDVVATNTTHIPTLPTPVLEKESTSTSTMDTPGRIKLTIPKSRLQVNTAAGGQSPPRGIPIEIATPKVKLKIPKDSSRPEKDRENRKRERERNSPPDNNRAKIPRASGYNAPQVGNNYHLPHSTFPKKQFKAKHTRQPLPSPHVQHFPISQPHNNLPGFNQPRLNHPHSYQQPSSYQIDQYSMNASMNLAPVYNPYGGMPPTMANPSYGHQGSLPPPNHQYYQSQQQPPYQPQSHFQPQQPQQPLQSFQPQPPPPYVTTQHEPPPYYPQYTHSVPNMSMPPPPVYNLPPPNYVHQPYIPSQPQTPENPPLPTEPPPKTPSPPPE